MTREEMKRLRPGDVIRAKFNDELYIVTANEGGCVTAVCQMIVTNPPEWEIDSKVDRKLYPHAKNG